MQGHFMQLFKNKNTFCNESNCSEKTLHSFFILEIVPHEITVHNDSKICNVVLVLNYIFRIIKELL